MSGVNDFNFSNLNLGDLLGPPPTNVDPSFLGLVPGTTTAGPTGPVDTIETSESGGQESGLIASNPMLVPFGTFLDASKLRAFIETLTKAVDELINLSNQQTPAEKALHRGALRSAEAATNMFGVTNNQHSQISGLSTSSGTWDSQFAILEAQGQQIQDTYNNATFAYHAAEAQYGAAQSNWQTAQNNWQSAQNNWGNLTPAQQNAASAAFNSAQGTWSAAQTAFNVATNVYQGAIAAYNTDSNNWNNTYASAVGNYNNYVNATNQTIDQLNAEAYNAGVVLPEVDHLQGLSSSEANFRLGSAPPFGQLLTPTSANVLLDHVAPPPPLAAMIYTATAAPMLAFLLSLDQRATQELAVAAFFNQLETIQLFNPSLAAAMTAVLLLDGAANTLRLAATLSAMGLTTPAFNLRAEVASHLIARTLISASLTRLGFGLPQSLVTQLQVLTLGAFANSAQIAAAALLNYNPLALTLGSPAISNLLLGLNFTNSLVRNLLTSNLPQSVATLVATNPALALLPPGALRAIATNLQLANLNFALFNLSSSLGMPGLTAQLLQNLTAWSGLAPNFTAALAFGNALSDNFTKAVIAETLAKSVVDSLGWQNAAALAVINPILNSFIENSFTTRNELAAALTASFLTGFGNQTLSNSLALAALDLALGPLGASAAILAVANMNTNQFTNSLAANIFQQTGLSWDQSLNLAQNVTGNLVGAAIREFANEIAMRDAISSLVLSTVSQLKPISAAVALQIALMVDLGFPPTGPLYNPTISDITLSPKELAQVIYRDVVNNYTKELGPHIGYAAAIGEAIKVGGEYLTAIFGNDQYGTPITTPQQVTNDAIANPLSLLSLLNDSVIDYRNQESDEGFQLLAAFFQQSIAGSVELYLIGEALRDPGNNWKTFVSIMNQPQASQSGGFFQNNQI